MTLRNIFRLAACAIAASAMEVFGCKPVSRRVKTVADAYNIYKQMREGDKGSAINRLRYQMKLDGEPPYSKSMT